MPLYKYTRAANAGYVARCTLCFSPPSKFNDPFDGLPDTAALEALPDYHTLKAQWEGLATVDPADEQLARGAALAGKLIEKLAKAALIKKQLDDLDSNFRVLCLSRAEPESMGAALMMGHYADSHQGFAYELDENHPWFVEHMPARHPHRDIRNVEYRDHRANLDRDGKQGLFVKSPLWSYEKEVRLIRFIGKGANDLADPNSTIASYPPEMLRAVVIGCLAEKATIDLVITQLKSRADLAHVRLERLLRHPDEYRFEREPITVP